LVCSIGLQVQVFEEGSKTKKKPNFDGREKNWIRFLMIFLLLCLHLAWFYVVAILAYKAIRKLSSLPREKRNVASMSLFFGKKPDNKEQDSQDIPRAEGLIDRDLYLT
jgi:hypothetical protein